MATILPSLYKYTKLAMLPLLPTFVFTYLQCPALFRQDDVGNVKLDIGKCKRNVFQCCMLQWSCQFLMVYLKQSWPLLISCTEVYSRKTPLCVFSNEPSKNEPVLGLSQPRPFT